MLCKVGGPHIYSSRCEFKPRSNRWRSSCNRVFRISESGTGTLRLSTSKYIVAVADVDVVDAIGVVGILGDLRSDSSAFEDSFGSSDEILSRFPNYT